MALLERWTPMRHMDRLRSEFDELLDRFGSERDWPERFPRDLLGQMEKAPLRPALESYVRDGILIVRTDLPGIDAKDVDIKVMDAMLTIKGRREDKRETKQTEYLRREVRYGSFERVISLPEGIKAEDLKATYRDGVLEISAPMPKETAPKEVKVQIETGKVDADKKPEPPRAAVA
jgi:HSP20 family protein